MEDPSEEDGMERYPRQLKLQKLLSVLDRTIMAAERAGDPAVMIHVRRGPDAIVQLSYFDQQALTDRRTNLSEELGLDVGETIGLLRLAQSSGYLLPERDDLGVGHSTIAHLDHLEPEGYVPIGELPDPQERLMMSLEAAAAAIEARGDLQPEQKEAARRAVEELKHFLRGLPSGVAVEVGAAFVRGLYGG